MYSDRPWLKNYPKDIPANIDPEAYPSVLAFVNEVLDKHRSLIAYKCMGKTLSYDQVDRYSNLMAAYLHSRGLEPGDKIAIMMPNLLQYPIAVIGALRAGLIIVNTNPLYTPREMEHQFTDSGVKAIIIAENFAANLEKILDKTNISIIITTSIGEMLGTIKGSIVNFVVKYVKHLVPKYTIANTSSFTDALTQGKHFTIKPFVTTLDDVILLQYTGGTTGVSKGAMLTNGNIVGNIMQIKAILDTMMKPGQEVVLSPLPMYHIFAFAVNLMSMIGYGAMTVLVTNARDLKSVIKEFKENKITFVTGVNTLFNALLNHPDFKSVDFSNLRVTVGGGMAVQKAVALKWKEVTGCLLTEGYGLTETSPLVSINPLDHTARLGTIGLPAPSTEVRIIDDLGNLAAVGQRGEIQVKGPQVMKGYYNKEKETEDSIKDGWFKTGDIAFMDEDGFFTIVDRKKDMILVSGFNVYPNEIEDVLAQNLKVLESAAVGIQDEKSGEVVKVFIVKKDESLTEKEVIDFCKDNLTNYKVPKFVEFRKELPKTNVGKILRRMLKEDVKK